MSPYLVVISVAESPHGLHVFVYDDDVAIPDAVLFAALSLSLPFAPGMWFVALCGFHDRVRGGDRERDVGLCRRRRRCRLRLLCGQTQPATSSCVRPGRERPPPSSAPRPRSVEAAAAGCCLLLRI